MGFAPTVAACILARTRKPQVQPPRFSLGPKESLLDTDLRRTQHSRYRSVFRYRPRAYGRQGEQSADVLRAVALPSLLPVGHLGLRTSVDS